MTCILITGVAGNLGSYLAKYILDNDSDSIIIGVDNLSTGKLQNISSLTINSRFHFFQIDVNSYDSIAPIFFKYKIEYIYHYAACAGVERTLLNPGLVFLDLRGLENIIDLSKKFNVIKILYSSSSEVYGEPRSLPLSVEHSPVNPSLPYSGVKALSEIYIKSMLEFSDVNYVICRFFNTYGPHQSSDYVIKKFLTNALNNEPLIVYGDGLQTRTFLYVDDNSEACFKLMNSHNIFSKTINIGSSDMISIKDLANIITNLTNSSSTIKYFPARLRGDSLTRQPENSDFLSLLSRDVLPIYDGILKVMKSMK